MALHIDHIDAIRKNDIPLTHELVTIIHDLLFQFTKDVERHGSEVVHEMYSSLPLRYFRAPFPGEDPGYDSVRRVAERMHELAKSLGSSITYPEPTSSGSKKLQLQATKGGTPSRS